MIFDSSKTDKAYDKWLEVPAWHEECGCAERCHPHHIDQEYFDLDCLFCKMDKCPDCTGNAWVWVNGEETECLKCDNTGRIKI